MIKRRLLILTAALLLLAGAAWWWARGSLPRVDGEWALPGLAAPVEVLADQHLVPHVYARDPEDAWFAVGVLHARDRAWQMELYRRAAAGRLAEMFGDEALDADKRLLTLGLSRAAEREWDRLAPDVRVILERYAAGVNAVFSTYARRTRPLEFQFLRLEPSPWTPVDSLSIGRLMAWRLSENHRTELLRHALARRFGRAEAQRLLGGYPAGAPAIIDGAGAAFTQSVPEVPGGAPLPGADAVASRDVRWPRGLEWLGSSAPRGSSNSWVIAGTRTATGRPLLANDPHLQIEMPSVWYEQHVVAAGLDVRGMAIPGVPFVTIGHNTRVAWGLTNSGADVQDFALERFDVAGRRYLDRGRQVPVDVEAREIQVRGQRPVPFEIWRTARGTVFADETLEWDAPPAWLTPQPGAPVDGERRALVLAWHGLDDGDMAEAFQRMNTARSWDEFAAGVSRMTGLSQNVVYADVDGHIGYVLSGSMPVRGSGDGTMPVEGWHGGALWTGATTADRLPRVLDPPAGVIATANNLVDRRWPGLVTRDWIAPFRARRLTDVLSASDRGLDLQAATGLQNDVESLAAAEVLEGIPSALALAGKTGAAPAVVAALERLRDWDRQVDGRPVVALYQSFEDALWRRTFLDEMDEPLFRRFFEVAGAERPSGLYAIIGAANSAWFDDIGTVELRESRADIMMLAAADAIEMLGVRFGSQDQWAWDRIHAARFTHPLAAAAVPLGWLFNRGPVPVSGDSSTVMRTSVHRLRPFEVWEYPSFRQVLDVGNWDEARFVLPAGQSGHPLSTYYFDQNILWREGRYRTAPFSRAAVDAARASRLLLLPQ